jgi:hypothetical protein
VRVRVRGPSEGQPLNIKIFSCRPLPEEVATLGRQVRKIESQLLNLLFKG